MKINKSVEQAVYVLLMLALQKDHEPVKSRILSQNLQVSDSYLKKILMTLKKNGLIESNISKHGGYQLSRPIDKITLKDVFFALNLNQDPFDRSYIATSIFPDDQKHVKESEDKFYTVLNSAFDKFYSELDSFKLSELLIKGNYEQGVVDWNKTND